MNVQPHGGKQCVLAGHFPDQMQGIVTMNTWQRRCPGNYFLFNSKGDGVIGREMVLMVFQRFTFFGDGADEPKNLCCQNRRDGEISPVEGTPI